MAGEVPAEEVRVQSSLYIDDRDRMSTRGSRKRKREEKTEKEARAPPPAAISQTNIKIAKAENGISGIKCFNSYRITVTRMVPSEVHRMRVWKEK